MFEHVDGEITPFGPKDTHINFNFLFCLSFQVDSSEKLSRLLGSSKIESCALITATELNAQNKFTDSEMTLVDFCENHWESPVKRVIKLPDK